jgi:N-dimethylarginine dimethylaminohydrolase
MALNFVTLGPRHVLMPAGCPLTRATYEAAGISCQEVEIEELLKAAGGMGCLTGILSRG